jgi:hypothetical protein
LIGEIVLLIDIAAFFIYMFVGSLSWDKGATIMPRIIILLGIPFWLLRVWAIVRPKKQKSASSNIMDTGFYIHQDPKMAMAGFIRITGFLILLYLGIWLFGFHVALPVGLFLYLLRYGQMGWLGAMIVGLVFLAVIIGVYDYVIEINWDTPLVLQLFGRS